jgi:hypothetical protein
VADGVAITAGSGTTIATDDTGGTGHVQIIKLAISTDGSITFIPADTANGLDVDVTRIQAALPAGTNNIGDVDVLTLPALATGTNTIGNVGLAARTSGGWTPYRCLDLDETEEEVKATAGQLGGWFLSNLHATDARFVKFYNATAASVVVGTTAPVLTIPLGAGEKANVEFTQGIAFSTAITIAATNALADADTGAPGANEVVGMVLYA